MPPLGFTDEEQFAEAARRFRAAAGTEDIRPYLQSGRMWTSIGRVIKITR